MAKRPSWFARLGRFAGLYPTVAWGVPAVFCTMLIVASVIFSLWRSAENNLEMARESNDALMEFVSALDADVKRYEADPSTLLVRHDGLQRISDAYDRLLLNVKDDELLRNSAVIDFKLAELKQHQGDLKGQQKYWQRSADKYRLLLDTDQDDDSIRFDLFQSLVRLNQLDAALQEIEVLTRISSGNPDYQDALCYCLLQLGHEEFATCQFAKARMLFDRASTVAESLPNDPTKETRYIRKKGSVKLALAKLAVVDGNFSEADKLLEEACELYLSVEPLSQPTHGEALEYLRCLRFRLSIAAFGDDEEKTKDLIGMAHAFSGQAINRFSACIHLRQIYCDTLRDYASFCVTAGLSQEKRVFAKWNQVLFDWNASSSPPTRAYLRRRLQFELQPSNHLREIDRVQSIAAELVDLDSAMCGFHLARAYFVLNKPNEASAMLRRTLGFNPGLIQPREYLRLRENLVSGENEPMKDVSDTTSCRRILATTESYAETQVDQMLRSDMGEISSVIENASSE